MLVNRNATLLALCGVLLVGASFVLLNGCQRSTTPPSPATQAADENARLREALERTGKTMEELVAQVERQQSREAEKAGDPPVARDLAVARATLTEAQKIAAQAKDSAACAVAVAQLRRVLQGLAAELPAALIVQHADRTLYLIKATVAVGSTQFADASLELIAAYDAANLGRPVELVPAVTGDLENAIKSLKKGDTDATIKTLNDVVTKALDNAALKVLAQAQLETQVAEAALGRGAWPVVSAELAQLESLLSQIVVALPTAEKTETAPAETKQTAPADATSTTPATGATPEAQQTPAAPGQQPAAQSSATQPSAAPVAAPTGAAPPPAATPTR
jgi:hypothetical protein